MKGLPDIDAMKQPPHVFRFFERLEWAVTARVYARTGSGPRFARGCFDIPTETVMTAFLLGYQLGSGDLGDGKPVIVGPAPKRSAK